MFFAPILVALVASILPIASAIAVPTGYKSVIAANLSSLAATSNFVIASAKFGTELNVGYAVTGNGNAVILYTASTAQATNQQWILNNVIGSPTEYTIESAEAPTFLSFPGAGSSTVSYNGQTIVDSTCYPTFTIRQLTPGQNGYSITENMFGGILTAWGQYVEGGSIGMATFQRSADLGAAQVWMIFADCDGFIYSVNGYISTSYESSPAYVLSTQCTVIGPDAKNGKNEHPRSHAPEHKLLFFSTWLGDKYGGARCAAEKQKWELLVKDVENKRKH
ncbi:hypothetical protein C8J57DRAFT_1240122 [Mycena rebaudengoi]|nr:hypothetical protein C8J57DRAFT_1240122 [Mycena rebaudengoi]